MLLNPEKRRYLQNIRTKNIKKKVNICSYVILFIIFFTNSKSKYILSIMANGFVLVDLQKHEV